MALFFKKKRDKDSADASEKSVPKGYTSITESLPEDVFIVGYPKSGNTWFQNLVAGVVYGVIPEYAPPALAHHDLIPDTHFEQFYKRYATPTFFKSHSLPQPQFRRVVYLLRDGRDAMVSYFHYLQALQENVDLVQMVKTGQGLYPGKWHEHVEAWLANPHQAEILTIRYEDLKKDAVKEMKRFCAFVKIERPDAFIEMIVKSAGFDKMQKKERAVGVGASNPKWQEGKMFFRRGEVGSYKDEMGQEALEIFLQEAGSTMRKAGYL